MFRTRWFLPVALALLVAAPARADRRSFTRTYEYMTMPRGETELELYTNEIRPDLDDDDVRAFRMQIEFEHGLTDRWDFSVYHVFDQAQAPGISTGLTYSQLKLRTRYRFAERGELPVDFVAYGEVAKDFAADVYEVELKPILARDFGKLTAALNLVVEIEFGDAKEFEQGFALGLTYEVVPSFKVGGEVFGDGEAQEGEWGHLWAGPSLSWSPAPSFWWAINAGFGLLEESDDLTVQSIFGLHL